MTVPGKPGILHKIPETSKLKWIRVDDVSRESGVFWLSIQFTDCFEHIKFQSGAGCAIGYGETRNDVINKLRELADILEKK